VELYLTEGSAPFSNAIPRYTVTAAEMARLTDTETPQSMAGLFALKPPAYRETPLQLYLDHIADPGNLGTILRTAAAANVAVMLSPDSCEVFNPKVIRASLGAAFYHPWKIVPPAELIASGHPLIAADMDGESLWTYSPSPSAVCIVGSEAHGISGILRNAATRVTIPLSGRMESLNAAIAAGIMILTLQAKMSV
jgi:TrmH family RNA methyltransferase